MIEKNKRFPLAPIIAVFPALIIYSVFLLLPAIGNIFFSFTDYRGVHSSINWIGFDNYVRAFSTNFGELRDSIIITVKFSLSVVIIQTIVSVSMAVMVNKDLRLRNFYRVSIFLPTVLGVVVHGLIWTLMFDPFSGPVNSILRVFGKSSALLGDPNVALGLVVFVMIWANMGYSMVLYLAGLQGVPTSLYESAHLDGAGSFQVLRYVTLPMIRPVININVLISIIGTLKIFDLIFILTGGGPLRSTTTLGVYIFRNLLRSGISEGYVAALQTIHFAIILFVVLITQKYLRKGEVEI